MKERPILFSAPMVRAILAGTKTQTRRVMKPIPHFAHGMWFWRRSKTVYALPGQGAIFGDDVLGIWGACLYGHSGDRLWVRETWRPQDGMTVASRDLSEIEYRADGDRPKEPTDCYWKPSIFMPRWASRITLEITAVRVQRLRDISEEDAVAEGLSPKSRASLPARNAFGTLWESINGKGSWKANPWVWCLTFKRITPKN